MTRNTFRACSVLLSLVALLVSASTPAQFFGGSQFRSNRRGGLDMDEDAPLLKKFDRNGDGWLNAAERKAALSFLGFDGATQTRRGRGGEDASQGVKVSPGEVKTYPGKSLYDPTVLRTLFLNFEEDNWEQELDAFHGTDVDVAATAMVDGQTYHNIGVHFRGQTSYMMVPAGYKRSLNLSFDLADKDQRLLGYRTLELLNSAADQTFLRTVLYMHVARDYIPAPKANYMRVVINGEDWGVYVNSQQFNSDFTKDAVDFKGARWKIKGRPGGQGGFEYLGEDVDYYKAIYQIKSKDTPDSWAALVKFCKVLNETPPEKLEAALKPLLDVDGALKFFALENVFINNDGFWVRASDYSLYTDAKGRFHLAPHDANETFRMLEQFGRRFGGQSGNASGIALDPLVDAGDSSKALLYRMLAAPALRQRYLGYVRDIAEKWLDWNRLGPVAQQYHTLIAANVKIDAHKLYSTDAFQTGLTQDSGSEGFGPISPSSLSIKSFAEQRRGYLQKYLASLK